jgi:hypothetical protein
VEYEIKRANMALLNQVKFIVDSGLLQTEQFGHQLSINTDIRKYLEEDRKKANFNPFQILVLTPSTFVEESHFYHMYYESETFSPIGTLVITLNNNKPGRLYLFIIVKWNKRRTSPFSITFKDIRS